MVALIVGLFGLLVIIVTIFGLMSRFGKHKIAFLRGDSCVLMPFARRQADFTSTNAIAAGDQPCSSNHSSSELAASIHTIGERRFYVLPENQIRVIEAPPTYIG